MERVKELEKLILKHKSLYYAGNPEINDHEYDLLEDELRDLDPHNFSLNLVGSDTSNPKVQHKTKMLSLAKSYDVEELVKWVDSKNVLSMQKIDGVSCSLIYENGKLQLAKTRGNGELGEDITNKVRWVSDIPKEISDQRWLEIRGELYCDETHFYHLSDEMVARNLEKPTNQRNIVAGLIGRKENVDLCKFIQFKSFDLIYDHREFAKESEKFKKLEQMGFNTTDVTLINNLKQIETEIESAKVFMSEGEYQIDGLVFTYEDLSLHEELGETAHHPRYKMAFKFQGESKTTKLNDIIWSVSRNGVLTPVGLVEPVELSGAKISRVTLHNFGLVRQHELKRGDHIEIIRSGEVIPKFLSVVKRDSGKVVFPTSCPVCETTLEEQDIRLVCINEECPGRKKEEILHFIQKIGIEAISISRLDEMIEKKIVSSIIDLYSLNKEDFLKLDKVKEKLSEKFFSEIQKSKETSLATFITALGIPGLGLTKCEKIIASGFNTIDKFLKLRKEELEGIEGFAEKTAGDITSSLGLKKSIISDLIKVGFSFKANEKTSETQISGKKICITGTLSSKRSDVQKMIKSGGGIVVSSVTSNTDYLVTNDTESSSSKFKKAKDLNIPIISEEKLKKLLEI